jgi:hypothetical protein
MDVKVVTINDPAQIPTVLDYIHDCWFDVEEIVFQRDTSVFSIRFKREMSDMSRIVEKGLLSKKLCVPLVECFLKIHHASNYRVNDTEHVGLYDFNELEYDPNLRRINITTGVPIEIRVGVERFEVSVEITDKVVDEKIVTAILS